MNIQSSHINRPQIQNIQKSPQEQAVPSTQPDEPKESFLPAGAATVGALAGGALGYHIGGSAGIPLGLLFTPEGASLGDALVNMGRGGLIGAAVGVVAFGACAGIGAYMAVDYLTK